MKPEKIENSKLKIEIGDDEKIILDLLEKNEGKMLISDLKTQSNLSGKKWDKSSKLLTSNKLMEIVTEGDNKYFKIVE